MADMTDRTQRNSPCTPSGVLRCDRCHQEFEDVQHGMVFWDAATDEPGDNVITKFALHHKRCHQRAGLDYSWSVELWWLADSRIALERLSSMADGYRFTGEQMQRLVDIAWAMGMVGTPEQRKSMREMREHGIL